MLRSEFSRVWRRLVVGLALAMSLVVLTPATSTAGECPYGNLDTCWMWCDIEYFYCRMYCSGYEEPYRTTCTEQCENAYFECFINCLDNCYGPV